MRFSRFTTIFRTLHRYGLDEFFVNHSRLRVIHLFLRWLPLPRDVSEPLPRRVRLALESLGPIFVKFGQVLSTRRDLLPPELRRRAGAVAGSGGAVSGQPGAPGDRSQPGQIGL